MRIIIIITRNSQHTLHVIIVTTYFIVEECFRNQGWIADIVRHVGYAIVSSFMAGHVYKFYLLDDWEGTKRLECYRWQVRNEQFCVLRTKGDKGEKWKILLFLYWVFLHWISHISNFQSHVIRGSLRMKGCDLKHSSDKRW